MISREEKDRAWEKRKRAREGEDRFIRRATWIAISLAVGLPLSLISETKPNEREIDGSRVVF